MLSSVLKMFTLPKTVISAVCACAKRAHIQFRFLAVFLTVLGDVGSIQNFPEKTPIRGIQGLQPFTRGWSVHLT
jgi:hypothetical protein